MVDDTLRLKEAAALLQHLKHQGTVSPESPLCIMKLAQALASAEQRGRDSLPPERIAEGGWVDVNDRVPEKGVFVIVCSRNPYTGKPGSVWSRNEARYFNDDDGSVFRKTVTHWMPLPPPPEPDK